MTLVGRMAVTALGGAMVIGASLSAPPAQAGGYVLELMENPGCTSPGVACNPFVTATGGGTPDFSALTEFASNGVTTAGIVPKDGYIITGSLGAQFVDLLSGPITGPTSFGSGAGTVADMGTGETVGIDFLGSGGNALGFVVVVPQFTGLGPDIFNPSTSLFESDDGTTFGSLGVTPGTYVWSWGSDVDESFTLIVGGAGAAPIPEPSGLAQLGVGLAGMALAGLWRKRRRNYPLYLLNPS